MQLNKDYRRILEGGLWAKLPDKTARRNKYHSLIISGISFLGILVILVLASIFN